MIDMSTEISVQKPLEIKDAKFSDWLPVSRLRSGAFRGEDGRMCGVGIAADFYGMDWSSYHPSPFGIGALELNDSQMYRFISQQIGRPCPINWAVFDTIYRKKGPEEAKKYVIEAFRRIGL